MFNDRHIAAGPDAACDPARSDQDMIVIRNLAKAYGEQEILANINLTVRRGEIAAVIGRSGAGKSSLLRCVNLLERPTRGTIVVDGIELTGAAPAVIAQARRRIGFIFQASSLLKRATVADNVGLPLRYAGMAPKDRAARVADLLARVGLAGRECDYPHALSGGEKQRVGIARALALDPVVLLADEPTSGLDPETTAEFLSLLKRLRAELGLTVLLITHQMAVVRAAADRAALIEKGRIKETGVVRDLIADPRSALGAALVGAHAALPTPAGQQAWSVTYGSADVPPDWLAQLGDRLGAPVSLLGGAVESLGGRGAGRLTLGFPQGSAEAIAAALAALGLDGLPLGDPA